MLRCAIRGAHGLDALYRKAELALLAPSSSQYFVYLPLSIQRSQARSKYIHVCSGAPSLAHKACTRYTERPIYAAGFLLFAVLCLSGTFDTRLAGTQQVHPCMFRCAIRGAHGLYALYRKADLRCWLPALRSPLFIWHFRYNAPCSLLPALSSQLSALSSQLSALSSQLSALSSQLSALSSQLSALGSRLPAPSSQLPAPSSRLPALGSQLPAPSSQLPAPISQI